MNYWLSLIIIASCAVGLNEAWTGMIAFPCYFLLLATPVAYCISGLTLGEFYTDIFMCGVRKIGYSISRLGREDPTVKQCWEDAFVFYWCWVIKFINPAILFFITVSITKADIEKPYEGYSTKWQVIGWLIPAIGLVLFIIATCMCQGSDDDQLDLSEFEIDFVEPKETEALVEQKQNQLHKVAPLNSDVSAVNFTDNQIEMTS